jgi:hypothetical protein
MKKKSPSADRYVQSLATGDALIIEVLRDFVLNSNESIREEFKFNCPFYTYHGLLCYLNFEKKTKSVIMGFVSGFNFKDKYKLLSNDTKQVRKLYFRNIDDLNEDVLNYYLMQAIRINETKKKKL